MALNLRFCPLCVLGDFLNFMAHINLALCFIYFFLLDSYIQVCMCACFAITSFFFPLLRTFLYSLTVPLFQAACKYLIHVFNSFFGLYEDVLKCLNFLQFTSSVRLSFMMLAFLKCMELFGSYRLENEGLHLCAYAASTDFLSSCMCPIPYQPPHTRIMGKSN